jgi:predicted molibdopterin-dependent oxidoreductase YjgC
MLVMTKPSRRLPLDSNLERGTEIMVTIDGERVLAYTNETVSAVLMAQGRSSTRRTIKGDLRGVFCGMGVCFDCVLVVDNIPNTRGCVTWVKDGMMIESQNRFSKQNFSVKGEHE